MTGQPKVKVPFFIPRFGNVSGPRLWLLPAAVNSPEEARVQQRRAPATHASAKPQRVSIRDVAERAGVSIATVSRALNSGQEINPDTRAQVMQVARELGYVASARGRGLVSGRTDSIGVIIGREHLPVFLNPFYGEVLGGIELELEARGLNLVLTSLKRDHQLLAFAAGQRVDGLLVIGHDLPVGLLARDAASPPGGADRPPGRGSERRDQRTPRRLRRD